MWTSSHLRSLDRSLASLITTFNSSDTSSAKDTSKLQSLLSTTLTPPPVASNPRNPQSHGRKLRAALSSSRLEKMQRSDREAKESGTVRARSSKTAVGSGREALSLRERRKEEGKEDKMRRRREGIGGVFGKERGGAIRLSKDEIARFAGGSSSKGKMKGKAYRPRKG